MKRQQAYDAIQAILAAIDDHELPKPSKVEKDGDTRVVWFDGIGRYLGSAKRGGVLEPLIYRENAAREAINLEAVYRLDREHQANL